MKKAPCVDVRTDVHKDPRFEVLGEIAGYNKYEAIGRMHALWSWCVDRGLQDAPEDSDGYVVSEAVVRRFIGPNGVTAILGDDCDDFALGERREGGRIYLRGTSEYVAERRARAAVSSAGGVARAAAVDRDQSGRFVSEPTNVQPAPQPESSRPPAVQPAAHQPTPASSSSSSPSDLQNTPTPRAIVQSTAWQRRKGWWDEMLAAHARLRAKGVVLQNAPDLARAPNERMLLACEQYLREGGYNDAGIDAKMRHVIAVNEAEAEAIGPDFFKPAIIWDVSRPDRFPRKVDTTVAEAQRRGTTPIAGRARAGPRRSDSGAIGAASPRADHPEDPTPRRFGEL